MVDINEITYLRKNSATEEVDWKAGVFVPIDKPFEWTSFDVVNKLRYQLKRRTGQKKFKVGHAGTLDPRATGLLILACGAATKSIEQIASDDKKYEGVIKIGATTPTYDGEMAADATFPIDHIDDALIEEARRRFIGPIDQIPPIFSAIKKDGKRLYQYARKGQEVQITPRRVEIKSLEITRIGLDELSFSCHCSKGTYIRSLAHDLGKYLKSGAYLKTLVRTEIGPYSLDDAWNLEQLNESLAT